MSLRSIIRASLNRRRYFVTQSDDDPAATLAALAADTQSDPDLLALRAQAVVRRIRDSAAPSKAERELLGRYIEQLPERDYRILVKFKEHKSRHEIARLVRMSVEEVDRSLVRTYAGMREWMRSGRGPDGGGQALTAPVEPRAAG